MELGERRSTHRAGSNEVDDAVGDVGHWRLSVGQQEKDESVAPLLCMLGELASYEGACLLASPSQILLATFTGS